MRFIRNYLWHCTQNGLFMQQQDMTTKTQQHSIKLLSNCYSLENVYEISNKKKKRHLHEVSLFYDYNVKELLYNKTSLRYETHNNKK